MNSYKQWNSKKFIWHTEIKKSPFGKKYPNFLIMQILYFPHP